jgi:hypothetical protein
MFGHQPLQGRTFTEHFLAIEVSDQILLGEGWGHETLSEGEQARRHALDEALSSLEALNCAILSHAWGQGASQPQMRCPLPASGTSVAQAKPMLGARETHGSLAGHAPEPPRSTSDRRSEISLFPDSAGNKGRFAQPKIDNRLVVVWGLRVLRRGSGETMEV